MSDETPAPAAQAEAAGVADAMAAWLPPHACGLKISHNEHLNYYQTAADWDAGENTSWASEEERARALETGEIWEAQWYPNTPVGFHCLAASSLAALLLALRQSATAPYTEWVPLEGDRA